MMLRVGACKRSWQQLPMHTSLQANRGRQAPFGFTVLHAPENNATQQLICIGPRSTDLPAPQGNPAAGKSGISVATV